MYDDCMYFLHLSTLLFFDQETSEGVRWEAIHDPFTCLVTQPEKKSKFKGMKHFIAYNVTPSVSLHSYTVSHKLFLKILH